MTTLNLVDIDKSDIKYQIQRFPDGQNNLVINPYSVAEIKTIMETNELSIQIKSRLNNWLDLELIVCTVASLKELGVEEIHLYTPYIMGARSDRKFEEGGNNYLRDVICPIINSLNFKTVTCIDPHSDVLEACIKGFKKESNYKLVAHFAIGGIIRNMNLPARLKDEYHKSPQGLYWDKRGFDNLLLIAPDGGASKKIYKLAEQIGYKGDIITCSKERDANGKLTKTVVPINKFEGKDLIIIDDIIDGGSTFINIVKELRGKLNNYTKFNTEPKIYLIVTHGIFSKGFEELSEYFDGIYCTNSYSDILKPMEKGTMSGVHTNMKKNIINRPDNEFVKQLNIF